MHHLPDIVVVAWNGNEVPLKHINFDATPVFKLYLFNYAGTVNDPPFLKEKPIDGVFSYKTEFKGELLQRLQEATASLGYRYIGILDDDHEISISAINRLLTVATELEADSFQPSITPDSYYSHRRFLQKKGAPPEPISWVEIMAPFLRKAIFDAAAPFYPKSISSYGIDRYVYPYLQRKMGMDKRFLLHEVSLKHLKPVTPGLKVLSSGLDPLQEYDRLREHILSLIKEENLAFSRKERQEIFELGFPRIFKWRDDLVRAWRKFTHTQLNTN
jgi:hypothetical protein